MIRFIVFAASVVATVGLISVTESSAAPKRSFEQCRRMAIARREFDPQERGRNSQRAKWVRNCMRGRIGP